MLLKTIQDIIGTGEETNLKFKTLQRPGLQPGFLYCAKQ
jgi:hypothetical protein